MEGKKKAQEALRGGGSHPKHHRAMPRGLVPSHPRATAPEGPYRCKEAGQERQSQHWAHFQRWRKRRRHHHRVRHCWSPCFPSSAGLPPGGRGGSQAKHSGCPPGFTGKRVFTESGRAEVPARTKWASTYVWTPPHCEDVIKAEAGEQGGQGKHEARLRSSRLLLAGVRHAGKQRGG